MNDKIIFQLGLIIILTLMNAFFASAEMAIVSLDINKIKIKAKTEQNARLLLKLVEEPSKFLATIQVGITLAGFFSSASAATGISGDFAEVLKEFNIPYSNQLSVIVITVALSYFMLVFGELFPKRLALQKAEAIAMFSVKPVYFISKLTMPFVKLLSASTNLLIKLFKLDKGEVNKKVTEEEIRMLVDVGREHGTINLKEKQMINRVFEFNDKLARQVMVPRPDVFLVNIDDPVTDFLDQYIEEKHSRIPVYEGDKDHIVGILLLKDFLVAAKESGFEHVNIREIVHQPFIALETKPIDKLFAEMQRGKNYMAILVDEYGGFAGIVTIEDLIEEVFGDISDEFDINEYEDIIEIDTDTYMVNGRISVSEFNHFMQVTIEGGISDTISGWLIHNLGRIPKADEKVEFEYEHLLFEVVEVKDNRIEGVKVMRV